MHNSIKSISVKQLETAFSKALADLTGKPCKIEISDLEFLKSETAMKLTGASDDVVLSMKISKAPEY